MKLKERKINEDVQKCPGKVPFERKKSGALISVKQEADGRIVLEWDWSSEESRTEPESVIRMSAVGDAQDLT